MEYECPQCGQTVAVQRHPSSCPDCGYTPKHGAD
ncbi:rubrerythrin-like domain-containing protein [Natronorubrum halophilum]|nr:rubrerythrin-like domain-containing protein [Natronorubrum halophilum]